MIRLWDELWGKRKRRYLEPALDVLKRKSVEAGLDPTFWDEIAAQPCCPGSLGPDDPGRLNGCKPGCAGLGGEAPGE